MVGCNLFKKNNFSMPTPAKMTQILADVHLAESMVTDSKYEIDSKEHNRVFSGVLEKHHITKSEFDSAVAYYSANPLVYQKIYENVIEVLTQREMAVLAIKDSLIVDHAANVDTIRDLWKGDRFISFNSADSTISKNRFSVAISDSVLNGRLLFSINYGIKTLGIDSFKTQLVVGYTDGSFDSIRVSLPRNTLMVDTIFEIKLKDKRLAQFSGQYVQEPIKEAVVVDVKGIRLKWVSAKVEGRSFFKKVRI